MNQILTDVNNEFAQYRLFVCRKELTLVHADILDAHFDNKCPSDKSELEPIDDPEHVKCPRCDKELKVEDIKPLLQPTDPQNNVLFIICDCQIGLCALKLLE